VSYPKVVHGRRRAHEKPTAGALLAKALAALTPRDGKGNTERWLALEALPARGGFRWYVHGKRVRKPFFVGGEFSLHPPSAALAEPLGWLSDRAGREVCVFDEHPVAGDETQVVLTPDGDVCDVALYTMSDDRLY
jgi:hypothetical protein